MNSHKRHLVGTTHRELRYDPLDNAPYLLTTTWECYEGAVIERTAQHHLTEDELTDYLLETQMAEDVYNDFYHDQKYQAWQE